MNYTGMKVRRFVSACGEQVEVGPGVVVSDDDSGVCRVDIMSLHGGAPWIVHEAMQ